MISSGKSRTHDMVRAALFAALLCIIAPFTVPIGPIPVSLATYAVYLAGAVLGWKYGCASVACYLMIGLCGVPVFSGFTGGAAKLAGPTGGFLIGYIPCVIITGLTADVIRKSVQSGRKVRFSAVWQAAGMIVGTAACYLCGLLWYMLLTGQTFREGLAVCVIPFLAGDSIKIVCAAALSEIVRAAVSAYRGRVG